MTEPVRIKNIQARKLFLSLQGLSAPPREKLTSDGLLNLIKGLGFVQVDSINTVARAHHMILFSRNQTYRPDLLRHLLEDQRSLFEHWTHDASVIPTELYPYWQHRFVREEKSLLERWRKARREGFEEMLVHIRDHVTHQGPVRTRDFKSATKKKSDGWWDWNPEKTALEIHWRTGAFAISGRDGFQKIYDLAERVIPEIHRKETISEQHFVDWACRSALERLGTASSGEIAAFWGLLSAREATSWVENQRSMNEIIDVEVEGATKGEIHKAVAFEHTLARLHDLPAPPNRLRLLSPFDPLIRDRKRCLRLFGFDYRIEVFVPKAKRTYGYYVFPLLEGHQMIGRIDVKCEKGVLGVSGLWLEPGVKLGKNRSDALRAELDRYRKFTGADKVVYESTISEMLSN